MTGTSSLRTRWAAIGAAVAVTLGGGITLAAQAVTDTSANAGNTYTPITPCRLMDTRSGSSNVGTRNTPISEGESHVATVHGSNGNCTIPTNATGIATNTTVLNGSSASFLTLYPANVPRPTASNLNWTAGQSATPNQVTVGLSPDGQVRIYNDRGTVNVIVDIVGIYSDPTAALDGRYYTKDAADDRFATQDDLDELAGTVRRTVSFPAQALNIDPTSVDVQHGFRSLRWTTNGAGSANLPMQRPADFAGTGTVTVSMTFTWLTGTTYGKAGFYVRPRNAPPNSPMPDAFGVTSNLADLVPQPQYYTVTMNIPASTLAGEIWELVFQRLTAAAIGPGASDMILSVFGVSVSYDSVG